MHPGTPAEVVAPTWPSQKGRVVPPRPSRVVPARPVRVVPPRQWHVDYLKPWEDSQDRCNGPYPHAPTTAPPKRLMMGALFKCLVNIYNLKKLEGGASFISHAREASRLKRQLEAYLAFQLRNGEKPHFPDVESRLQLYFCNSGKGGLRGDASKMGTADQSVWIWAGNAVWSSNAIK